MVACINRAAFMHEGGWLGWMRAVCRQGGKVTRHMRVGFLCYAKQGLGSEYWGLIGCHGFRFGAWVGSMYAVC